MSRGLRNNNPGNIRKSAQVWRGEITPSRDPAFKQFASAPWGYRAMFVLLDTYRRKYGIRTLRGIISRYAPESENDTAGYLSFVIRHTQDTTPDDLLDFNNPKQMCSVVCAMSRMENGVDAIEADVTEGWSLFTTASR